MHLRRRRRLIPLVNDTGVLLCDATSHLIIQPLKPVDCTRAKRRTCFLRRRCKSWFMTSLGSLIEFVGLFDVAARLRSGDRPIAALVGRAIYRPTARVSYVIPTTASIITVKCPDISVKQFCGDPPRITTLTLPAAELDICCRRVSCSKPCSCTSLPLSIDGLTDRRTGAPGRSLPLHWRCPSEAASVKKKCWNIY